MNDYSGGSPYLVDEYGRPYYPQMQPPVPEYYEPYPANPGFPAYSYSPPYYGNELLLDPAVPRFQESFGMPANTGFEPQLYSARDPYYASAYPAPGQEYYYAPAPQDPYYGAPQPEYAYPVLPDPNAYPAYYPPAPGYVVPRIDGAPLQVAAPEMIPYPDGYDYAAPRFSQPMQQTAQLPVQQPMQQPMQPPVQQPMQQTAQPPVQQPMQQTAQPPVQQPTQQTAQPPVQQPMQQTTQPPVQQPIQQTAQPPVQQPVQQPTQPPVQRPTQQPVQPPVQPPVAPIPKVPARQAEAQPVRPPFAQQDVPSPKDTYPASGTDVLYPDFDKILSGEGRQAEPDSSISFEFPTAEDGEPPFEITAKPMDEIALKFVESEKPESEILSKSFETPSFIAAETEPRSVAGVPAFDRVGSFPAQTSEESGDIGPSDDFSAAFSKVYEREKPPAPDKSSFTLEVPPVTDDDVVAEDKLFAASEPAVDRSPEAVYQFNVDLTSDKPDPLTSVIAFETTEFAPPDISAPGFMDFSAPSSEFEPARFETISTEPAPAEAVAAPPDPVMQDSFTKGDLLLKPTASTAPFTGLPDYGDGAAPPAAAADSLPFDIAAVFDEPLPDIVPPDLSLSEAPQTSEAEIPAEDLFLFPSGSQPDLLSFQKPEAEAPAADGDFNTFSTLMFNLDETAPDPSAPPQTDNVFESTVVLDPPAQKMRNTEIFQIAEKLSQAVLVKSYSRAINENNLLKEGKNVILEVDRISSDYYVSYGGDDPIRIYSDISFSLHSGSCMALLSDVPLATYALARTICESADSGYDDEPVIVADAANGNRGQVIYIGSDGMLPGDMICEDFLMYTQSGVDGESDANDKLEILLSQIGMGSLRSEPLENLTYAQRILVLILAATLNVNVVCVVVNDPKFVVEAEDDMLARRIFALLTNRGKSCILASCNDALFSSVANRVTVIKRGKMIFNGEYKRFLDENCLGIMSFNTDNAQSFALQLEKKHPHLNVLCKEKLVYLVAKKDYHQFDLEDLIKDVISLGADYNSIVMDDKSFSIACKEVFKDL